MPSTDLSDLLAEAWVPNHTYVALRRVTLFLMLSGTSIVGGSVILGNDFWWMRGITSCFILTGLVCIWAHFDLRRRDLSLRLYADRFELIDGKEIRGIRLDDVKRIFISARLNVGVIETLSGDRIEVPMQLDQRAVKSVFDRAKEVLTEVSLEISLRPTPSYFKRKDVAHLLDGVRKQHVQRRS